MASSAQHHQGDGPASSLGRVSVGTEQCAVVVVSLLKLRADPSIPKAAAEVNKTSTKIGALLKVF